MDLTATWAFFVLVIVVMLIAALPVFRCVDNPPKPGKRYSEIDGLRGFLALSVFVFHLVVTHQFIETGNWGVPDSRFYALLGPVGVSLFFMITGFLFWGKMLRLKGRPRWHELYIGRIFRIGPIYLVVVIIMLVIVFSRTGLVLNEPLGIVISSVLQWLSLGIVDTQPNVNGYKASHVLAGVTWTIWYEWVFYASLLATAYFSRGKSHLLFVVTALILCLISKTFLYLDAMGFAVLFLTGMAIASLLHMGIKLRIPKNISSTLALSSLAIIFTISQSGYSTFTAILLALFFYLVCSGSSLFGLLTLTASQRMGNISYSLYLMQGLILTSVFSIEPIRNLAMASSHMYWLIGILSVSILFISAVLGYIFIERPGIDFGKRLTKNRASRLIHKTSSTPSSLHKPITQNNTPQS